MAYNFNKVHNNTALSDNLKLYNIHIQVTIIRKECTDYLIKRLSESDIFFLCVNENGIILKTTSGFDFNAVIANFEHIALLLKAIHDYLFNYAYLIIVENIESSNIFHEIYLKELAVFPSYNVSADNTYSMTVHFKGFHIDNMHVGMNLTPFKFIFFDLKVDNLYLHTTPDNKILNAIATGSNNKVNRIIKADDYNPYAF